MELNSWHRYFLPVSVPPDIAISHYIKSPIRLSESLLLYAIDCESS